jgi:protein-S-isoprenylcysteine O-methyltransferase Ste14
MPLESILSFVVFLFPLSELALLTFRRSGEKSSSSRDRGSLQLLWLAIVASVVVTIVLQWHPMAVLPLSRPIVNGIALCLLTVGIVVRWVSILTLGKYFSVDVAVQDEQILVRSGLYNYARHPSYTGLLIEFLGLAVYFGTWVSLFLIVVPITGALMYRIRCEEAALLEKFGKEYRDYMAQVKSLIPGIL